jgi:hypothetical protein
VDEDDTAVDNYNGCSQGPAVMNLGQELYSNSQREYSKSATTTQHHAIAGAVVDIEQLSEVYTLWKKEQTCSTPVHPSCGSEVNLKLVSARKNSSLCQKKPAAASSTTNPILFKFSFY